MEFEGDHGRLTIVRRDDTNAEDYGTAKLLPAVAQDNAPAQKRSDVTVLLHLKGTTAPFATTVYREKLDATLEDGQEWHWAIVEAKGVPPSTVESQRIKGLVSRVVRRSEISNWCFERFRFSRSSCFGRPRREFPDCASLLHPESETLLRPRLRWRRHPPEAHRLAGSRPFWYL